MVVGLVSDAAVESAAEAESLTAAFLAFSFSFFFCCSSCNGRETYQIKNISGYYGRDVWRVLSSFHLLLHEFHLFSLLLVS